MTVSLWLFDAGVRLAELSLLRDCFNGSIKKLGFLPRRCGSAVPWVNKTVKPVLSGTGHFTGAGDFFGIHKGTGIVILSMFLGSYWSLSSYPFLYFWETIIKLGKWVHSWIGNYFHKSKVKVSHSLIAVGAVGVRVPLYLGHS